MKDWIEVGSTPPGEPCAQVGQDGYYPQARQECRAYINLLRRVLGPEPEGARLVVRSNPHDFGQYLEVVCEYDVDANEKAYEYAYACEGEGPELWDDEARVELGLPLAEPNNSLTCEDEHHYEP